MSLTVWLDCENTTFFYCPLTLKGSMLGAAGGNEVERYMGRTADVFMRKSPSGAFVTSTDYTLADKVSASNHEDEQDDGNHWANGVGPSIGDATGGGRYEL